MAARQAVASQAALLCVWLVELNERAHTTSSQSRDQ